MNRHKGFVVVALIHFVLWSLLFLYCVTGLIYGNLTAAGNPLEASIAFALSLVVGMAFINSLLLFFSVRGVCRPLSAKKPLHKAALGFFVTATVLIYVLIILIYTIGGYAWMLIFPVLWLACTVTGSVLLCVSTKKPQRRRMQ